MRKKGMGIKSEWLEAFTRRVDQQDSLAHRRKCPCTVAGISVRQTRAPYYSLHLQSGRAARAMIPGEYLIASLFMAPFAQMSESFLLPHGLTK